jgi:hypothetical protein
MQIKEAKRVLELAGYEVVDENKCSFDNVARLLKETLGISAKINKDGIYFDYDEFAVEINKSYEDAGEYKVTILDEATNKLVYEDTGNVDKIIEIIDNQLD